MYNSCRWIDCHEIAIEEAVKISPENQAICIDIFSRPINTYYVRGIYRVESRTP